MAARRAPFLRRGCVVTCLLLAAPCAVATAARDVAPPRAWQPLGLSRPCVEAVAALGWATPTAVQRTCIPALLEGRDLIGQASTGSGKTAAYALPLLQRLAAEEPADGELRALVIVPTRELGLQVADVIKQLALAAGLDFLRVGAVYGGTPRAREASMLARPPHVLVATPGRLLDHLDSGHVPLLADRAVPCAVLDEADRLFELGFFEDVTAILEHVAPRQLAVFSATMPDPVLDLVGAHAPQAERVLLSEGTDERLPQALTLTGVRLAAAAASRGRRGHDREIGADSRAEERHARLTGAILEGLCAEAGAKGLVFCNTRAGAMSLWKSLRASRGDLRLALLSGEMEQEDREQSLFLLRQGAVHALVSTDLGARGLDVGGLDFVVQHDLPPAWDDVTFVHRAGRAARAEAAGECVCVCASPEEERALDEWVRKAGAGARLTWRDEDQVASPAAGSHSAARLLLPEWSALRIGGGKKDKVSKGDILGAITALPAVSGQDVGRIEVFARHAFVGCRRECAPEVQRLLSAPGAKIKKQRRTVKLVNPDSVRLRRERGVPPQQHRRGQAREGGGGGGGRHHPGTGKRAPLQ